MVSHHVWHTSNLRPLRLGEKKKKIEGKKRDENKVYASAMQGGYKYSKLNQKNTQNAKPKQTHKK